MIVLGIFWCCWLPIETGAQPEFTCLVVTAKECIDYVIHNWIEYIPAHILTQGNWNNA